MGLCFSALTPEQRSILLSWLNNERVERQWTGVPSEIVKQAESMDRTVAIELIQFMISKGILTKTDLEDLVAKPILI